jgi:hypothetical protein
VQKNKKVEEKANVLLLSLFQQRRKIVRSVSTLLFFSKALKPSNEFF